MYATIILSSRQAGIGNGLTYRVPLVDGRARGTPLHPGMLVRVPLRKRLVEGIIVELSETKPKGDFDVKEIAEVVAPLLTDAQIATAKWIAEYYLCNLRQALSMFLPGNQWGKLLPEKEEWVRASSFDSPLRGLAQDDVSKRKLGKKQTLLLEYLEGKDWVRWKEVREPLGIGRETVKKLIGQGMMEMKLEETCRGVACNAPTDRGQDLLLSMPELTPRQTAAYKAIKADPRPTLLFGVTGSGKTEIYAALIRDIIQDGKSAILLLPEILLTENFIERFQKLVQRDAIALIHSRLTSAKRHEEWRRCRAAEVKLVIGSRSALFSPLPDLGLIIIDEEHEWTYKNEQTPRYHAKKVAEMLCGGEACHGERRRTMARESSFVSAQDDTNTPKLLLGTATPSLETWQKATEGLYQLVELPERYGNAPLPRVHVIDLATVPFGKHYPFSPTLLEAIRRRLERNEQCVLFLNRRGFATSLLCLECRQRVEDPVTKLPYTVHQPRKFPISNNQFPVNSQFSISHSQFPNGFLLSHHTGEKLAIPSTCPRCHSPRLRAVGAGTERLEDTLRELFPSARILRADADTLTSPEAMRILLTKMQERKADILLGTQSVVKGLDLPGVTLAAVLLADIGLSLPHFRAGERVFQLLTQLAGRSGRSPRVLRLGSAQAPSRGEVIIQTFRPEAVEVALAAAHDVRGYLERELEERRKTHYPPDTELVRIVFSGVDAKEKARKFCALFERPAAPSTSAGPLDSLALAEPALSIGRRAPARSLEESDVAISRSPTLFSGGRDWQVLLRGRNVRELLRKLPAFEGTIDVDPVECL